MRQRVCALQWPGVKADGTVTGVLGSTEEAGKSPKAHGDIFVVARVQISLALLNLEISQETRASPNLLPRFRTGSFMWVSQEG